MNFPATSSRRSPRFLLVLLLLVCSSSCMQGPREKLLGRWYTSDTSIRFRDDGTVVFNTPQGLAIGRYHFDETPKDATSKALQPNLILELVRSNRQLRLDFELEILSRDRIRMTEVLPPSTTRRSAISRFKVLKRAVDDASSSTQLAVVPGPQPLPGQ